METSGGDGFGRDVRSSSEPGGAVVDDAGAPDFPDEWSGTALDACDVSRASSAEALGIAGDAEGVEVGGGGP